METDRKRLLDGIEVALAPLAGITDAAYRAVCVDFGADLVVSEMVSADALVRGKEGLRALTGLDPAAEPLAVQLFGSQADIMAEAAAMLSEASPLMIDLNFGCPVRKVVRRGAGGALLGDPRRLGEICKRVVEKSKAPVSAKIRAGLRKPSRGELIRLARIVEDAGVGVVTVHARTVEQGFSGKADWSYIKTVKDAVGIGVIGNGDVRTVEDFFAMKRQTGCDCVMIGRGAVGNPWIFAGIKARLSGADGRAPEAEERLRLLLRYVARSAGLYGDRHALVRTRKVAVAFVKGLPGARELRGALMRCTRLGELGDVVEDYLSRLGRGEGPEGDWIEGASEIGRG